MDRSRSSRRRFADQVHGSADEATLELLVDRVDLVVDARGTFCPEPVIRTQNSIPGIDPGQTLMLLADDAGVEVDIPAWCISTGNEFLGTLRAERLLRVFVRRA